MANTAESVEEPQDGNHSYSTLCNKNVCMWIFHGEH